MAKARLKPLNLTPSLQVVAVDSELPRVLWGSGKEVGLALLEEPLALQKGNVHNLENRTKPTSLSLRVIWWCCNWRWLVWQPDGLFLPTLNHPHLTEEGKKERREIGRLGRALAWELRAPAFRGLCVSSRLDDEYVTSSLWALVSTSVTGGACLIR